MENLIKSLIGQKYVPNDNSYSLNLTCEDVDYRLAGTYKSNPKECVIVSDPYDFEIRNKHIKGYRTHTFINVKYKGDVIRVLFDKQQVNVDLKAEILKRKQWAFNT